MTRKERARWKCILCVCALMVAFPDVALAADGMRTGMLIAYASLGLAGLVGIIGGIWWSWDLRRNQDTRPAQQRVVFRQPSAPHVERTPLPTTNTGEFRVEPSSPAKQLQVVLRAVQADPERECPRCNRTFPQGIVVCPIDATPLKPLRTKRLHVATPVQGADKPFCNACGRVYADGTKFCYHDGQQLINGPTHGAVTFHVCKKCGWETDIPTEHCPHDGQELTVLDPKEQDSLVPTIPMMSCKACGHVGGPAQTRCPNDGQMLYPVLNVRLQALPTAGVGPRRKVCTTCGKSYSRAGNYCAHDGEKLTPLN